MGQTQRVEQILVTQVDFKGKFVCQVLQNENYKI